MTFFGFLVPMVHVDVDVDVDVVDEHSIGLVLK